MESQIDKSFANSNIAIGNMLRFRTNPKFSAIVIDVIRKIIHKFKFLQRAKNCFIYRVITFRSVF